MENVRTRYHMLVLPFTHLNYWRVNATFADGYSSYTIMGTRRSTKGFLYLVVYIELRQAWDLQKMADCFKDTKGIQLCWKPQPKVVAYCKASEDFLELGDNLPEEEVYVTALDKPEVLSASLERKISSFYEIEDDLKLILLTTEFLEEDEAVFAKGFFSQAEYIILCSAYKTTESYESITLPEELEDH